MIYGFMSTIHDKIKILATDDIQVNLDVITAVLEATGNYLVVTAKDGKTAIQKAKSNDFDLILMDIMMPEMDGFEVIKALKKFPNTKNIPIICLTAINDKDSIKKAFQLGAFDYITKPFSREELLARIGLHVKLKHTIDELVIARKNAMEVAEARSLFLANMSHEIRTPMNGIIGMVDILKKTKLAEDQRDYLAIIESSGDSLLSIINDLLDYSKLEAGKLELENIPFMLSHELNNVFRMLDVLARKKDITLSLEIDEMTPDFLTGDPVRLKQIIINLVNNAIKFTHVGGVTIKVDPQRLKGKKSIILQFEITDTGIGISEDGKKALFQSFSQADKSTTRKFGGTGLGLVICKNLVEMMGGEIGVESVLGKGSTFWFTAVFDIIAEDVYQLAVQDETTDHLKKTEFNKRLKILLAEDNKINQKVASAILSKMGHVVDIANNGKEAVDLYRGSNYDIIFMDIQMPEMDGMEATLKIREFEEAENKVKKIPIIALTANAMEKDREKYLGAGMDDYISKPFKSEELVPVFIRFAGD